MTIPITIEAFHLTGFRAYLRSQSFLLHRGETPLSLAVFSPNAKGKSSLVDAFEFYFSKDATLTRLGVRAAERNAGRAALKHVEAQAKGLPSTVQFSFRRGPDEFGDSRTVTLQGTPLTTAAELVLANCALPFIIRGHELRGFVEQQTPGDRYQEVVKWFGLQPLLRIQENLRALRRQVKQRAEDSAERQERIRNLGRITGNAVQEWEKGNVCKWFNSQVLAELDKTLTITAISKGDTGYQELGRRKKAEDERVGIAALRLFLTQIEALHKQPTQEGEDPSGAIVSFEKAAVAYRTAAAKEAEERGKASQTVFNDVWEAAKRIFDDPNVALNACPVCDTQFPATPYGSRDAIQLRLTTKLGGLADYRAADRALRIATQALSQANRSLVQSLDNLASSLKDSAYGSVAKSVTIYKQALAAWKMGDGAPDATATIPGLKALHTQISEEKTRIENLQGEHTYTHAVQIADSLIELNNDLRRIEITKMKLLELSTELDHQAHSINKAIVQHTQSLIGKLKDDVNELYKEIQVESAATPPIHLDLPDEADTNQQRLQLLVDFTADCKGVVPTGYLSDSQIHALALSLRLAAIRLFNGAVPIIVLDDVVTSYDVEHRKNIAAMIAKHFGSYQIILVTHDERFFMLLQDHLPASAWSFRRITEVRPDFGPMFQDHRTPDEVIQAKLERGESAANEIRQAEEEWLMDICRGFGVKVIIRPLDRAYKYERGELACALAQFLKSAHLAPPKVPGIANPFLVSLQKGDIENFGSHFSDNPTEAASSGDERTRWEEFTYFRNQFVCPNCLSRRFLRPEPLTLPICKKCQTPFSFKAPEAVSKDIMPASTDTHSP